MKTVKTSRKILQKTQSPSTLVKVALPFIQTMIVLERVRTSPVHMQILRSGKMKLVLMESVLHRHQRRSRLTMK